MIQFSREQFKNKEDYPEFHALWLIIKKNHKIQKVDIDSLRPNRHIKDFCVISRHFMSDQIVPGVYLSYETCTWVGGQIRIDNIILYDNQLEYETDRSKINVN